MLRLLGKVIAGAAAAAVTTYLGSKFLQWAGVRKIIKKKKPGEIQELPPRGNID